MLLVLTLIVLPELLISNVDDMKLQQSISKGVFKLLDQSIAGLNQAEINNKIIQYKKAFNDSFDLIEISTLNLTLEELKLIQTTVLYKENEMELYFLYRQSKNSSKVWQIISDTDVSISLEYGLRPIAEGGSFIKGLFYLIEEKLLKYDISQWQQVIKELQPLHGYNLVLKKIEPLDINAHKVVNITKGSHKIIFIKQIKESHYVLQFGPIIMPWVVYNIVFILLFSLAILVSIISMLWVWPLWKNLSKIKQAALDFGEGRYNTRIPKQSFSSLNLISYAFNKMAEQTQRSINSHKELTSAVSHELRTPVARMRFSLEMLISSKDKLDRIRYINDITQDIDELDLLLAELLTYSRFDNDSSQIIMQSQLLTSWFKQSMQRLDLLSNNKILNYAIKNIKANEYSLFEPRLMSRVLDNLVQNAFHYAKQQIKVTLTKENKSYILTVEDDGIGIPEDESQRIFEAFSRIDQSRDRDSGGFGLGLAIVKRIIKGHQGTIQVKKSNLGGALFKVKWSINQTIPD